MKHGKFHPQKSISEEAIKKWKANGNAFCSFHEPSNHYCCQTPNTHICFKGNSIKTAILENGIN